MSETTAQRPDDGTAQGRDHAGSNGDGDGVLRIGELEIRLGEGLVLAGGRALTLTVREFQLLVALVGRIGGIVSREELYRSVWGRHLRTGDRSVDVYVSKVRGKLADALPEDRFIHTHPGFGYRFEASASRNLDNPRAIAGNTGPTGGP